MGRVEDKYMEWKRQQGVESLGIAPEVQDFIRVVREFADRGKLSMSWMANIVEWEMEDREDARRRAQNPPILVSTMDGFIGTFPTKELAFVHIGRHHLRSPSYVRRRLTQQSDGSHLGIVTGKDPTSCGTTYFVGTREALRKEGWPGEGDGPVDDSRRT
jgi:hypothetical protein